MNSRPNHRKNKLNQRDRDEPITTAFEPQNPAWQSNSKIGSRYRVYTGTANYTWKYKNKTGGLQASDLTNEVIKGYKGDFNRNEIPQKAKKRIKSIYASEGAKLRNDWVKYVKTAQEAWYLRRNTMKSYPCVLSDPILQLMYHAIERNKNDSTYGRRMPVIPSIYPFVLLSDIESLFKRKNESIKVRNSVRGSSQPAYNEYNPFDRIAGESNSFIDALTTQLTTWNANHPDKIMPSWRPSFPVEPNVVSINDSTSIAPPSTEIALQSNTKRQRLMLNDVEREDDIGFNLNVPESDVQTSNTPQYFQQGNLLLGTSSSLPTIDLNSSELVTSSSTLPPPIQKPRGKKILQIDDVAKALQTKSFQSILPIYQKELTNVINSPNNYRLLFDRTLFVNQRKNKIFYKQTVSDFKKLSTPESWLSGDNIEAFTVYYNRHMKKTNQYFLSPYEYITYIYNNDISRGSFLKNFKKWIIIPQKVNNNNHWFVMTVEFFPVNGGDQQIIYYTNVYDSLNDTSRYEEPHRLINNFIDNLFASSPIKVAEQDFQTSTPILQKDAFNCGIYTLITMLLLYFKQNPMDPEYRYNFSNTELESIRNIFSGFLASHLQILPPLPTESDDNDVTISTNTAPSSTPTPTAFRGRQTSQRLTENMIFRIKSEETLKKMKRQQLAMRVQEIEDSEKKQQKLKKEPNQLIPRPKRDRKSNQLTRDYEDIGKKR